MKKTLPYFEPVVKSTQATDSPDLYFGSFDLFEEGKYVEAIRMVLDSNNPDISEQFGNEDGTEYHIPHGSVIINISITPDGMLNAEVPFMRVPKENAVAMLRAVASLNTGRLMLARFYLEDEMLSVRWSCPLSEAHPSTFDWQINNMCRVADDFDDEFVANFGAERLCEPIVTRYDENTIDRLYDAIQSIGRITLEAVADFTKERRFGIAWNALMSSFCQIDYVANPQGNLKDELNDAIRDLNNDEHTPESVLVKKASGALEKILAKSKEDIAVDLYETHMIESAKRRSTIANMQKNFKEIYRNLLDHYQGGDYSQAAVGLIRKIYEAYHYCDMDDSLNEFFVDLLKASADRPFEDAGRPLISGLDQFLAVRVESDEEDEATVEDDAEYEGCENTSCDVRHDDIKEELRQLQSRLTEALQEEDFAAYALYATRLQQCIMTHLLS